MLDYDALLDIVRQRRSIRRFTSAPVPDELIEKILEVARWSPSGGNGQPWEFIVIKDKPTIEKIATIHHTDRIMAHNLELTRVKEMRHPQVAHYPNRIPFYSEAPAIIAVSGDLRTLQATVMIAQFLGGAQETFRENLTNATITIHLAAAALGLGTQWVSVGPHWEGPLKTLLNVPDFFRVFTIVPIGYPAYHPRPTYRRELPSLIHRDRYDRSKLRSDTEIAEFISRLRKQVVRSYPEADETDRDDRPSASQ